VNNIVINNYGGSEEKPKLFFPPLGQVKQTAGPTTEQAAELA